MSYRDETDSLRAKITSLEQQNAEAKRTIARLRGEAPADGAVSQQARVRESKLAGGPVSYEHEIELPHAIDERGYEAIAKLLRERLGANATQVGKTLTVPGVFSLSHEGGVTRIRLTGRCDGLAGGVVAAGGMAAFLGGMPVLGVLADMATHGTLPQMAPFHALWIIPAIGIGIGALVRRATARKTRAQLATHAGVFEAIVDVSRRHAIEPGARPSSRVRVDAQLEAEPEGVVEPAEQEIAVARRPEVDR